MWLSRLIAFLIGRETRANGQSQKALFIIDMQKEFLNEHHPDEVAQMISAQIELIRECKKRNVPIIVIEYKGSGSTIPELQAELSGYRNLYFIVKKNNNAFLGTALRSFLEELGVEEVILAGVNASYCVFETAQSAIKYGLRIITSEKLISDSPRNKRRDKSLWWYSRNGELSLDIPRIA